MKKLNFIKLAVSICMLFLLSCHKNEVQNNVVIEVKLIDENEYLISDNSGINITLSGEKQKFNGNTDSNGKCTFYDFPVGKFKVELEKSGFISQFIAPELTTHIDDSTNVHSFKMLEIPRYQLALDSIRKENVQDNHLLVAKGKINNMKGLPKIQYSAIAYFNSTNKVSKVDYLFYHFVSILNPTIIGNSCEYRITNWTNTYIVPPTASSLFVKIYPRATYPEWTEIREEAFGTPSDVFEWHVQR